MLEDMGSLDHRVHQGILDVQDHQESKVKPNIALKSENVVSVLLSVCQNEYCDNAFIVLFFARGHWSSRRLKR